MNLKLAKKIRQGMREMAQVSHGGAIRGIWPEDYEGEIQRKRDGSLWAETTETPKADGTGTDTSQTPTRIGIRLKLTSARQVYKRAKQMVQR